LIETCLHTTVAQEWVMGLAILSIETDNFIAGLFRHLGFLQFQEKPGKIC
jgi:hypothetical protein